MYRLLTANDSSQTRPDVISLTDIEPIGEWIRELGIPVRGLEMDEERPNPLDVLRLASWLRQSRPDVVHTWMYHANLVGGIAAKLARVPAIIWHIHHTTLDPERDKARTIKIARWSGRISGIVPHRVVSCSESGCAVHVDLGYRANKMLFIPNGFDLTEFHPTDEVRVPVRRELGVPDDARLVAMAARFNPQKDHHNFVEAAAWLHRRRPDIHFVLCGNGVTWENAELAGWIRDAGLESRFHLLGRRDDMSRLYAAFDVVTLSSSHGEAFPLVIGEAMASGVPCVVTDIGDSALIVGDTGIVVPPRDPKALGAAWMELIDLTPEERAERGRRARQRIEEEFSVEAVARRFVELYREVLDRRRTR